MSILKGSKVLVTGGAGFIGSNLILRLASLGCSIRATLHKSNAVIPDHSIEYVKADLTIQQDCARVVSGIDYVFMCAANTSGSAVINEDPLAHVTPNVLMNAQMLDAAYKARIKKFLFLSSSAAYPATGSRPVCEEEMFIEDPPEVYYGAGWMKRYSEILCRIYAQKIKDPMPTVVIRPSNIYGPHDKFDFKTSHVTAALVRRVAERQDPIEVWGTGEDLRDLIYVDDFLDGLLKAFEASGDYLAVNIASGTEVSVRRILETLLELEGYKDARVCYNPAKPRTVAARPIDTGLAKRFLGFSSTTALRDGLLKTIEWFQNHP